jgi:hypothetical protein
LTGGKEAEKATGNAAAASPAAKIEAAAAKMEAAEKARKEATKLKKATEAMEAKNGAQGKVRRGRQRPARQASKVQTLARFAHVQKKGDGQERSPGAKPRDSWGGMEN